MKNNSIRTVVATGIGAALLLSLVCLLIFLFLGIPASNFSMLFKPYSQ